MHTNRETENISLAYDSSCFLGQIPSFMLIRAKEVLGPFPQVQTQFVAILLSLHVLLRLTLLLQIPST